MRTVGIWLCTATLAAAQWDPDIWPSWTAQRSGKAQATDCYHAITERVDVANNVSADYSYPSSPAWYKVQKFNLANLKTATKAIVGEFVCPMDEGYVNYLMTNLFLTSGDTAPAKFLPHYSASGLVNQYGITNNILWLLNLPTNYFDYTPWRCLNEHGPFTNDAAVTGRGHGWTNETTAAGGTHYPSGRTKWYTTDYGWNGLQRIVDALRMTEQVRQQVSYDDPEYGDVARFRYHYDSSGNTNESVWTNIKNNLNNWYAADTNDYTTPDLFNPGGAYTMTEPFAEEGGWQMEIRASLQPYRIWKTGNARNYNAQCTFYVLAGTFDTSQDYGFEFVREFDNNGDGYSHGWNTVAAFMFDEGATNDLTGRTLSQLIYVGHTNMVDAPDWPASASYRFKGYSCDFGMFSMDWNFAYTNAVE
jgi:hypothetical protein